MARSRFIYTLKEVAGMIGENLELIEEVTANSDNIAEGELVYGRGQNKSSPKSYAKAERIRNDVVVRTCSILSLWIAIDMRQF
ncbi:hypothetical protein [Oryzifoliimicrobium ureilyticus]|uniref:hypothetical protein n=1 Tax=Oryzifoliimicrobium ureilyticus TaxID=3113724 RepID=UPI00307606C5